MEEQIKKEADRLIELFRDHVNPYIGSGMLSNTHDDHAIKWQSTHCAIKCVDQILDALLLCQMEHHAETESKLFSDWSAVKKNLEDRL